MYVPNRFKEEDTQKILKLAEEHSFATLVTVKEGVPFASHLPLMIEGDETITIVGHMAKANEQWQHFQNGRNVMVIYRGPHAYISPSNYEGEAVPTWNYAAIHMYGKPTLIFEESQLKDIVDKLTMTHENNRDNPWQPEYRPAMLKAIVGFEIEVTRIDGKYKLSQNRPEKDRQNIISSLSESSSDTERKLGKLMSENTKQ